MAFLLRVELPDVPGSLGAVATVLGAAGADIEAIEIVEHRADEKALDDVLLELPASVMPDALITACHALKGVRVHWISRYNAGANLIMDLEAVEEFTAEPARALERFVDLVPATFRADWALAVRSVGGELSILHETQTAPKLVDGAREWLDCRKSAILPRIEGWESTIMAGAPLPGTGIVVVFGRHGGPEILTSEIARFGHMASLAGSVAG